VGRKDGVVGLNNRARQLGSGVHTILELRLFAVVRRQPLQKESAKAGAGSSAERVEDEEALQT
jgi:hypothetical protein